MNDLTIRRNRHVYADSVMVGWVIRRRRGVFHAYILLPNLGCTVAAGTTSWEAAAKAWSARCVLHSSGRATAPLPPTEELGVRQFDRP